VWTNIIDNAIYAVDKNGELTIETSCDHKNVKVKIIDNGSGITQGDYVKNNLIHFLLRKK
jgi:signal transduction histidine kinase